MQTPSWLNTAGRALKENSPAVLSGIAVAGVIGTVVLAVKATPEAVRQIEELQHGEEGEYVRELEEISVKEKFHATWRLYIPATLTGVATIACIVGSNAIGARRTAAVYGAYTLVDSAFREYKDRVISEITPSKAEKVKDNIQIERVKQTPPQSTQIYITGTGDQLCYDSLTGRYFRSDVETIRRAANTVNARVLEDMFAPHDDFYELLGLGPSEIGRSMGWQIDNLIELEFTSTLSEETIPCLCIGYTKMPRLDYHKL